MTETVERTEVLVPEPAHALGALLGVEVPDLERDGLPLLWHWIYLLDRPAQTDLGPDGHPVRHTVPAPPEPGRRRMWAGGRVRAPGTLRCGIPATRRTAVQSIQHKTGRTGPLTFVVVEHQIVQRGEVVVDERQDLVYREATTGNADAPLAADAVPAGPDEWPIDVTPTLLFRYSALTYNAHRIHYDRDYARDVEGYPGLVTHGPLQALAMAEAARSRGYGAEPEFAYRLVSPLFDHQGMVVQASTAAEGITTAVRDHSGRQTASGLMRSTRP
ncbi:MaoC family dehydratase N-terminal domain-containing protein [Amycolatopsis sp. NBC_00345]|uniref:FAS1-like dehydratase domain-containing protein n=1 Tax=Amycolatopsis sp. NBC_00345 TaxID=2975955 RepID=UPI002E275085